jgi:hypothetical protein
VLNRKDPVTIEGLLKLFFIPFRVGIVNGEVSRNLGTRTESIGISNVTTIDSETLRCTECKEDTLDRLFNTGRPGVC